MDRLDNAPADLAGALRDIRAVNRFLGGSKVIVDALRPMLRDHPGPSPLAVLDVGTGSADVPVDLVREARKAGRAIRVVAVDRDPVTLAEARRTTGAFREIEVREADATDLPFDAGAFDVVTASMFLHHFDAASAASLLTSFRRIARRAVLVNDLERHLVPWAAISVLARATRRHPMFVHDAPLSVLRGFTAGELREAAAAAGAPGARLEARWPYRWLLTLPGGGAA